MRLQIRNPFTVIRDKIAGLNDDVKYSNGKKTNCANYKFIDIFDPLDD